MLKTIERVTKQRIDVEKLPTVADLRARRLELTRSAVHDALVDADDLDHFRVVVETLSEEFDVVEIALAAIKLWHEASGAAADESEIPEASPRDAPKTTSKPKAMGRGPSAGMTRLFVGAGRKAGIRPQDLVGAIANETSLSGRDIGAIEITDKFSLVEVPESKADEVIAAIKASTIKGKKQTIRRDQAGGRS
jgi:ATP-dependent RNA helicase DeaD